MYRYSMNNQENEIEKLKQRVAMLEESEYILEELVRKYANRAGFFSQYVPEKELNRILALTSVLDLIHKREELDRRNA